MPLKKRSQLEPKRTQREKSTNTKQTDWKSRKKWPRMELPENARRKTNPIQTRLELP